jgi:hypothetical protein
MLKVLTMMIRKEEGPLPWARYCEEVGKDTTTPPQCPREEESDTTHRLFVRPDPIPAVPFALGLLFITGLIEGRVEGSIIGGIISCAINRPIPRAASQPTFLTGSLASPFAISI